MISETKLAFYPLASRVLAVAVIQYKEDKIFDWAVYIDSIPGHNHIIEAVKVSRYGAKQPVNMATTIFPYLPKDKYRD